MDRRTVMNFITKRSTIWTLSLCVTGALALGGITLVDRTVREDGKQMETELNELAYLEEELAEHPEEINDTLGITLQERTEESQLAEEVAGNVTEEILQEEIKTEGVTEEGDVDNTGENSIYGGENTEESAQQAAAVSVGSILSEQTLVDAGIQFSEENILMWPAAGTILIDYSMDGSVYFPTLNQYKYNPALIIGSETGNQVLASAKGMVESVSVDDETGTTLVLNIGNGFKLTYGQLKDLTVEEGDVVEAGALIGYVDEPTKYYSQEGSNLYFKMTQNDQAVDPVLYLEG